MATAYVVERTIEARAPAERLHALISDFHQWPAWSPWEDVDPAMRRDYSGSERGVGAVYSWSGNRKAGAGRMRVTGEARERVEFELRFDKPVRSESRFVFLLEATDQGTEVTWRMTGEQTGLMGVLGKVVSMDRMVGKDFEKGLTRLKAVAEQEPS